MRRLILILFCVLWCMPAWAVEPDEVLTDPALEARARTISKELRCLVCQNESIDDSHADLARDLRLLVRERLTDGDSNREVVDYVVARYGEFVLLRPPLNPRTLLLWMAPLLTLALGGWALSRRLGAARSASSHDVLSPEEEARLAARLSAPAPPEER